MALQMMHSMQQPKSGHQLLRLVDVQFKVAEFRMEPSHIMILQPIAHLCHQQINSENYCFLLATVINLL
ncbi:hypothetical protein PSAC2689_70006 [Paraburkholderia sacchari]